MKKVKERLDTFNFLIERNKLNMAAATLKELVAEFDRYKKEYEKNGSTISVRSK
jgi:hypothetical protein